MQANSTGMQSQLESGPGMVKPNMNSQHLSQQVAHLHFANGVSLLFALAVLVDLTESGLNRPCWMIESKQAASLNANELLIPALPTLVLDSQAEHCSISPWPAAINSQNTQTTF
jgi:hypothetical protein